MAYPPGRVSPRHSDTKPRYLKKNFKSKSKMNLTKIMSQFICGKGAVTTSSHTRLMSPSAQPSICVSTKLPTTFGHNSLVFAAETGLALGSIVFSRPKKVKLALRARGSGWSDSLETENVSRLKENRFYLRTRVQQLGIFTLLFARTFIRRLTTLYRISSPKGDRAPASRSQAIASCSALFFCHFA